MRENKCLMEIHVGNADCVKRLKNALLIDVGWQLINEPCNDVYHILGGWQ